jgi:hypothetical protein
MEASDLHEDTAYPKCGMQTSKNYLFVLCGGMIG